MRVDVVLSSGFLAFARHAGVLKAVEEAGLTVDGLCGTSSGALVGALWAAGLPADAILAEVAARRPYTYLRPRLLPWNGAFSIAPLVTFLRRHLPATFAALGRPFGVGVRAPDGRHALLTEGALPEAVAASCALPWVFAPIRVAGVAYQDGGAADRLGLGAWRALRGDVPLLVHLVERSAGRDVTTAGELDGLRIIRTARSGARFWNLGDVAGQMEEARRAAHAVIRAKA